MKYGTISKFSANRPEERVLKEKTRANYNSRWMVFSANRPEERVLKEIGDYIRPRHSYRFQPTDPKRGY